MSNEGFARKYRPQTFEEVVGQKEVGTILKNSIANGKIHHAYLFFGSRGVGKTSMARILAKALNCVKGQSPDPCNACPNCLRISKGEDADVGEIDGASNRGIDEIRDLKENAKYRPTASRYKIFIIDEVHMLTEAAFNALLKILEEPPEYVKFIFATTEIHKIPVTILSRCQRFNFNKITIEDIINHLKNIAKKENLNVTDEAIAQIAHRTGGALRDSLVILEQLAGVAGASATGIIDENLLNRVTGTSSQYGQSIIESILEQDVIELFKKIHIFYESGGNIIDLLQQMTQQFRDMLVQILVPPEKQGFIEGSEIYFNWLQQQSKRCTAEYLHVVISQLLETQRLIQNLQGNILLRIVLETCLLKILRIDSFLSLKKIEQTLTLLEDKISPKGKVQLSSTQPSTNYLPQNIQAIPQNIQVATPAQNIQAIPQNIQVATPAQNIQRSTQPIQSNQNIPEQNHAIAYTPRENIQNILPPSLEAKTVEQTHIAIKPQIAEIQDTQSQNLETFHISIQEIPQIEKVQIKENSNIQPILQKNSPIVSVVSCKESSSNSIQTIDLAWENFMNGLRHRFPKDEFMLRSIQHQNKEKEIVLRIPDKYKITIESRSKDIQTIFQQNFQEGLRMTIQFFQETLPPIVQKAKDLFNGNITNDYLPPPKI